MIGQNVAYYKITEKLGGGGMGVVYKAEDSRLGRQVALKFLPEQICKDPRALERFRREARTASSLNHPNICTIHAIDEHNGQPFIVMELLEGQTLKYQTAGKPLKLEQVVNFGVQIAEALETAHSKGIVHRDLKPANVFLTTRGQVKILDFGLAKLVETGTAGEEAAEDSGRETPLTRPGAVVGTPAYCSPEQIRGENVDGRSDIFSFGALLYELATGKRPFQGETAGVVSEAILNRSPAPASRSNPELSHELDGIINKALEKERRLRYQTVSDLRADLERLKRDTTPEFARLAEELSSPAYNRYAHLFLLSIVAVVGALLFLVGVPDVLENLLWPSNIPAQIDLAVLPFTNIGRESAGQAFCDGLVETLTSKLTQLEQFQGSLFVVPASELRDSQLSPSEARKRFGVNLVITGSLQREHDSIRLTLNLVDTETLRQLSSEVLDESVTHLVAFQDNVVARITEMLQMEVRPEAYHLMAAGGTRVPSAYELYLQGRGYLQRSDKLENIEKAIDSFQRALDADPEYALAHAGLGEAYWLNYQRTSDTRWVEPAISECQRAAELDDQVAPTRVTLGLIYEGTGRYQDAVEEFHKALQLDPRSADTYQGLARAYEAQRSIQEAESTYRKAISLKPRYWAPYNGLGAFYLRYGRYTEAEEAFLRVTELVPDSYLAYSNLGALYHLQGRYSEAGRMLERSLTLRPNPAAYSNLGIVYYYQGRYAEAAAMMEKSVQLGEPDYLLWGNLGDAYRQIPEKQDQAPGAYRKAIELAKERLTVNLKNAPLRASLAVYWAKLGNKQEALAEIEKALDLAPEDVNVLFRSVLAYELCDDRDQALKFLEAAVQGGYSLDEIRKAPHLQALRRDPRYQELIGRWSPGKAESHHQ